MESYYLVSEIVDEDGGFGDAVPTKIPLAVFPTYQEANAYVDKYSNETIYEESYMALTYGKLVVDPVSNAPQVPANQLPAYDKRSHWRY